MAGKRRILVPDTPVIATSLLQNPIRQYAAWPVVLEGSASEWERRGIKGVLFVDVNGRTILGVPKRITRPPNADAVLQVKAENLSAALTNDTTDIDWRDGRWIYPFSNIELPADEAAWVARCAAARESWKDRLEFRQETRDDAGNVLSLGLRTPQIGALHAILAHWTVTNDPATAVMPTGTGKTETMLATLLRVQPHCLLVIVPTDALREQISRKFLTLGVLPTVGVLTGPVTRPVVGTLKRRPRATADVRSFFTRCNVVVTTMAVAGTCLPDIQREMAAVASHLIIDEAHHISAKTWAYFRNNFTGKPILQFTATPFRRDRKHVDGRIIYDYPLRKAQEEGLFQRVNFRPVFEYGELSDADEAIAEQAIVQLEQDLASQLDHLVMARGESIERADNISKIYERKDEERERAGLPRFGSVLVHSEMSSGERRAAIGLLHSRKARVVICVDMFGEGFDMPELKIAALHDVHKSLAITLQFVGRFTRSVSSLGEATVIVNLARAQVEESVRALYAEDADWNEVLRDLSTGATKRQIKRTEFLKKFDPPPAIIPLQNLSPAMSTVIYRVAATIWRPDEITTAIGEERLHSPPSVNNEDHIAVFITRELDEVEWGDVREIVDITWDLYIVHWDSESGLLYICSSNKGTLHKELAEAVGGDDAVLIRGEAMFRVFHNVRRLVLLNLGLRHAIGRNIQFTMYVGADILENLSGAAQANKIKSNMYGYGYESGSRVSYGCSYKGRVWSHQRASDLVEWMEWSHSVAAKLIDEKIDTAEALKFALIPKQATTRPNSVPFAVQWPHEFYLRDEEVITFEFDEERATLLHVGIDVASHSTTGPLELRVFTDRSNAKYELQFAKTGVTYVLTSKSDVFVTIGRRRQSLAELFREHEPAIYFTDGSSLRGDALLLLPEDYVPPFARERIESIDWTGVAIKKESQGPTKDPTSVQRRIIDLAIASTKPSFDIVFDDDAAGEAADVVTLRVAGDRLLVQLIHCKFAQEEKPGARIGELYEVCGQSQKSAYWKGVIDRLLAHLDRREADRLRKGGPSRFEKGDVTALRNLRRRADRLEPSFEIVLVQPGLSRRRASDDQLELLAVTELYLQETYRVPLRVIASE